MDYRVSLLLDELKSMRLQDPIDLSFWRIRFNNLFSEISDETSRVALLDAHAKVYDLAEAYLIEIGTDPGLIQATRCAEWNAICILEAQLRSTSAFLVPGELKKIMQRERLAGRMQDKLPIPD